MFKLCLPYRVQYLPGGVENPLYEEVPRPCYHHVMVTEKNRPVQQAELQEHLNKLRDYTEIVEKTKINSFGAIAPYLLIKLFMSWVLCICPTHALN
jgi:hypothetical protein